MIDMYMKNLPAAPIGIGFGLIKNCYKDAIEYKGVVDGTRGLLLLIGFFCIVFFVWSVSVMLPLKYSGHASWLRNGTTILTIILSFVFSIYFFIKCVRIELFRPVDEPTIFDRKNRKVYRIFRKIYLGWGGLVKRWPMYVTEYDWDLIDVEHQSILNVNEATISRVHSLVFKVRKSVADDEIVDSFTIGNSMLLGETTVPAIYEHIRRFMEEGGAHIPYGESLSQELGKKTFLQCLIATGPYGETLKSWWRYQRVLTVIGFLLFPLTYPFLTLLGVCSWLSHKTSIPISWPSTVLQAVGSPMPSIKN